MLRYFRKTKFVLGFILVLTMVSCGVFATVIAPYRYTEGDLSKMLHPGFWNPEYAVEGHFLGTDYLGRDIFSRILFGTRISLFIGSLAAGLAGLFGVTTGLISGYIGGKVDALLLQVANSFLSFPSILLALVMIQVIGVGILNLVIVLAVTSWPVYYRVVRAQTLSIKEVDYITAARAVGCSNLRIILHHILPNLLSSVLVLFSLEFPRVIIEESFLSFLGLGVQPPTPSLGGMLSDYRKYLFVFSWLSVPPGLAIIIITLGLNLLGDSLRDLFDPKMI